MFYVVLQRKLQWENVIFPFRDNWNQPNQCEKSREILKIRITGIIRRTRFTEVSRIIGQLLITTYIATRALLAFVRSIRDQRRTIYRKSSPLATPNVSIKIRRHFMMQQVLLPSNTSSSSSARAVAGTVTNRFISRLIAYVSCASTTIFFSSVLCFNRKATLRWYVPFFESRSINRIRRRGQNPKELGSFILSLSIYLSLSHNSQLVLFAMGLLLTKRILLSFVNKVVNKAFPRSWVSSLV